MQAPRLHSISLPRETFPFSLHTSLTVSTTISIDLALNPLHCANLSSLDASRPATNPPTSALRIVHPALLSCITVYPSIPHSHVTVSDVLTAIHTVLSYPLHINDIPAHRRADVLSYHQSKPRGTADASLRVVDLLEGASMFCGLEMDVANSNRLLGVIDAMQSLTWILITGEPSRRKYAQHHLSTPFGQSMPLTPLSHGSPAYGVNLPQYLPQHPAVYFASGY